MSDAPLRVADSLLASPTAAAARGGGAGPVPELHLVTFPLDRGGVRHPDRSRCEKSSGSGEITRVPQAPPHVRGVTNLRGRILPVVEIRTRWASRRRSSRPDRGSWWSEVAWTDPGPAGGRGLQVREGPGRRGGAAAGRDPVAAGRLHHRRGPVASSARSSFSISRRSCSWTRRVSIDLEPGIRLWQAASTEHQGLDRSAGRS